ncbi:protein argonaute 7 [Amaranthus tricolor]|uniref:protein argonaute 7 n=1 Tax=Amaranthus tricolor TaxID=29722 RepID=UPI002584FEB0|nr:protein argonaute 7 [Amaranthus tricolor]
MEETEESNPTRNLASHSRNRNHHHNHLFNHHNQYYNPNAIVPYNNYHYTSNLLHLHHSNTYRFIGFLEQNFQQQQGILPLPPILPFQVPLHQTQKFRPKTHYSKPSFKPHKPIPSVLLPASDNDVTRVSPATQGDEQIERKLGLLNIKKSNVVDTPLQALVVAKRPDCGGKEGQAISLLANHFRVKFDPCKHIFHYNVEISPNPPKEVARLIKKKVVEENSALLCGASPAFDGRKNLYSPVEFRSNRLEFFVGLPMFISSKSCLEGNTCVEVEKKGQKLKVFRININLVSRLDGNNLKKYLNKEGDDCVPLPQEFLHALDVVLRECPNEKCYPSGRSMYSKSMGGAREIGGGAVGLRGFFQSLRPTKQGLALNVDFSVTAFHESIGVIDYLQKRLKFLHDLHERNDRFLTTMERKEVEKELKNLRVFVSHRDPGQKYRFHSLTEEVTEKLWFEDRDGSKLRLLDYFKDHYEYDIQYRNLPCLQISRSKPCYLPMELCTICEGQKFLGKLSDDQTAKIMKMGSQKPRERRAIINGVMNGPVGPTSGCQGEEFNLQISREMTRLNGRVLMPPKLKLGDKGLVSDVLPTSIDRKWSLLGGHVSEGARIERWAMISFGGTPDQKSHIAKFISQLSLKCEQMGIFLNKSPVLAPQFEPIHVLNNVTLLENKLYKIQKAAVNNLQLLLCIMEKKHKGYANLKRIAETRVGVVSQCCLYTNLSKLNSQFLTNMALKINAKVGGSTVALFRSLPSQIPRLLTHDEPLIFMGADVSHPHPLDDSSPSVVAVVGSLNWPSANKYVSRMRSQTHRQEIIEDLGQMVHEILVEFCQVVKALPRRIIFFRDGVSETQFYKVLKEELQSIRAGCDKFLDYKPLITFVVVQKRHHTRLFPDESDPSCLQFCDENIPPGTVVDTVITHPTEFDFYLCSHWGAKGTSRPTHYHVLWDESKFTSDEFQKLVYSLCFTFVRCTKPISIVPAAYYAHLAAYRGRLYLERSDSTVSSKCGGGPTISRVGPPKATPLPKISENVKKLMFYC